MTHNFGLSKIGNLRNAVNFSILIAMTCVATSQPVLAQQAADPEQLLRIIEQQQQRLDEQAAQLAEHQRALKELRGVVEQLKDSQSKAVVSAATGPGANADDQGTPLNQPERFQTAGAAPKDEWPGFYRVPGTNTQFKIGGFVELDLLHDTDDVYTPSALVTSAIVTRSSGSQAAVKGQTNFSVQASRFSVETRTPLKDSPITGPRRVTTFFAWDMFNDFLSTTPQFRLREAYGEVDNFLLLGGNLLLGQTWSTYTNLYAVPNTLEFQTPNAVFGTRLPMVRWTKQLENEFKLKIAAEAPDLRSFDLEDLTPAVESSDPSVDVTKESRYPDGVLGLSLERELYNMSAALVGRELRASNARGETDSAFGWGATFQGRVHMPGKLSKDFMQFGLTYGKGIGGLFNDVPPDAVYDVEANRLLPIPTFGAFVSYQHQWSDDFSTLLTYGYINQDNEDVQLPTAYHQTMYSTANIVWTPDPRWLLGFEVAYGSREDLDGEKGSDIRTIMTSRFNF